MFMCLDSSNGEQTYLGLWFLPVWHEGIPDYMLLFFVFFVPVGAATHFHWSVCVVGVFPCFLCVPPLVVGFVLSMGQPCTRLVLVTWGGLIDGRGLIQVGFDYKVRHIAGYCIYFLFFRLLQLATRSS